MEKERGGGSGEMGSDERKLFHFQEVAKHNNPKDCWLIINGKVYDVTQFLDDHPGGDDPLLQVTGKDASDDFEDVGHSNNAREVMKEYYIGDIDLSTMPAKAKSQAPVKAQQVQKVSTQGGSGFLVKLLQFLVPFGLLAIAFGIRKYTKTL
ncbi:unnamed protein product [Rhodiola kirilowii]